MTIKEQPTAKFRELTNRIGSYWEPSTGHIQMTEKEAREIDPRLGSIVKRLAGSILVMQDAEPKVLEDGKVYEISGQILGPKKMQNVPGFGDMEFDLACATHTLRITDNGRLDTQELDPTVEIELAAEVEIDGEKLPMRFTTGVEANRKVVLGDSEEPVELDLLDLGNRSEWSEFREQIQSIGEKINLTKARFYTATITVDMERSKGMVRGFGIEAGLAFGPVMMKAEFYLEPKQDSEDKDRPMKFSGTVGAEQGSFKLGQILGDAIGVTSWPAFLDLPLSTLKLSYEFMEMKDRVHKEYDAYRLVLSSPADDETPSLLLTTTRDAVGKIVTARIGFPALQIKSIPLLEGELTIGFEPLLVVMSSHAVKLGDLADYCAMKKFPGLEFFGRGKAKKEDELAAGIYLAGLFKAADAVAVAVFHPLKTKKHDVVPFDPNDLDESEEVTPLPVQEKKKKGFNISYGGVKTDGEWVTLTVKLVLEGKGLKIEPIGLGISFVPAAIGAGRIRPAIDGAALSFRKGDLVFSGGMVRDTTGPGAADWIGTALLSYGSAFAAGAMFAYRDAEEKQLFLFGYLRRQLGGPPWCYITGLAFGFGYNRRFDVPPVEAVRNFPMIDMARRLSAGENPVEQKMDAASLLRISEGLRKYVKPENGTMFGMVGVTFKSGPFIQWTVLLAVSGGNGFEVALIGYGVQDIPAIEPGKEAAAAITHIEYQVVGAIKPADGFLGIDAVLGPNSFILSKNCRLMGGFALRTWFSGQYSGDWVISLGGYHPAYTPPKHYPIVPRVGVLWKLSESTRIMGFAYLAITSKNLQVGAGLDLQYELGPLRVWFHAEVHALVEYKPLRYDVWVKVDIGVSFRLKLLFCTVTLSLDLSAQLHFWGPEFSGHCELHFWFASVSFSFGSNAKPRIEKLAWTEFVATFITPTPEKPESLKMPAAMLLPMAQDAPDPKRPPSPLEIVPLRGITIVPAKKVLLTGGMRIDWIVDPQEASFKVSTAIPARHAVFGNQSIKSSFEVVARPVTGEPVIDPKLDVTFTRMSKGPAGDNGVSLLKATAVPVNVPAALWGRAPLKPEEDTTSGNENILAITNMSLEPIAQNNPETSVEIPIDKLLFEKTPVSAGSWHRVQIPTKVFSWDRDNPYATIRNLKVTETRKRLLDSLAERGLVDADAASSVRVDNVRTEMPCFMAEPVLCSLGTAKISRAERDGNAGK